MTLALLVYAIAERRIRAALNEATEDFIDPVYGKTKKLTMRRAMQMMLNINQVTTVVDGIVKKVITGITDLRKKIILMVSRNAAIIYEI